MNTSIDSGILELAIQGRLSAISCMSKGASFLRDAPSIAALPVERGLHLNLTEVQPNTRFFQPLPSLIINCSLRRVNADLIKIEIEEQCDNFEMTFHQAPHFVDGHQHVHQLPVVRDVLLKVLKRRYGTDLLWIRSTCVPKPMRPSRDWAKAKLIEALGGRSLLHQCGMAGFKTNHHLLGVFDFARDNRRYLAQLDTWIGLASPGDVIMCHPSSGADASDPLGRQREIEFAAMSDPSFKTLLAKHNAFVAISTSAET